VNRCVEVFGKGIFMWGVLKPDGTLVLQNASGRCFRGTVNQNRNVALKGRNGERASGTLNLHGMLILRDDEGNALWGTAT